MEERIEQMRAEREKKRIESDAIESVMNVILGDAPEDIRIEFDIVKAFRKVHQLASDLTEEVISDSSEEYSLEAKKEILEYLTLVAEGIKTYTETIKAQLKNEIN